MKDTTISMDVAKSVFELAVSEKPGRVSKHLRLSRRGLARFFAQQPGSRVLLEACGSSHHWARHLGSLGHTVRLLPPHHVRRYRQGNKTDRADAKALLEADRNEKILPTPVKSEEQQALASLHRLRSGWVTTRTARINMVRGLLREFGLTIPRGARRVVGQVRILLEDPDSEVPFFLRSVLSEACDEIRELERRVRSLEQTLRALSKQSPLVTRLMTVPGVGLLTATALVVQVGDIGRFRSCRHFAGYLGLTPREYSSGSVRRLGGITKRGDSYLRMLLIHGGRSVLQAAKRYRQPDRLRAWALEVEKRRGYAIATVAVANRIARIVWSVWTQNRNFESRAQAA